MKSKKLELRGLYDETAGFYDHRYTEIQRQKYSAVIKHLPSRFGRALDVGCGTGLFLDELRRRARFVVGVDISEKMLNVAQGRGSGAGLLLADAESLPFKDQTFDCVISVTLLQNVPSPENAVAEFMRILKNHGLVVYTSLKRKHSAEQMCGWAVGSGLKVEECVEIEDSEDIMCVTRRQS